ncbi:Uncharacterised protein [Candidatus Ornithobacterium hominis]|uniref:Uncharacterized protein n=1 Tax=Candidatus Ornithobacterium hominis TaxID=2497989 RepID=A0A383TXU6_9FLAO|nr:hypothetical protein [Candidatus Ornithobacterium hominis]MCT7904812.1 hypothetical protein [Candidatus Ornithobacterium hominis]SZD71583.1 Uncharacterised protein [Candidatus Ornithobacterium hominis]SZD72195.1 Uncharacterised protein [Candidatus Ornithobacterium hominis]
MKFIILNLFAVIILYSCTKKNKSDYPILTKEEAITGFKYLELKHNKYVFNEKSARDNNVSNKIIKVLKENTDSINDYLKNELGDLYENKDSVDFYLLRLINFQEMDENDFPIARDSIFKDIQIK